VPEAAKVDPKKVAAEIESMQQDLKALQEALGQLVDALITEEKPGLKEIKRLETLKKHTIGSGHAIVKKAPAKQKTETKVDKTKKPRAPKQP
jgi:hypothetical protein